MEALWKLYTNMSAWSTLKLYRTYYYFSKYFNSDINTNTNILLLVLKSQVAIEVDVKTSNNYQTQRSNLFNDFHQRNV